MRRTRIIAIVAVPVRTAVVAFDATENIVEPEPVPLVLLVIVIHETLLVAFHVHPAFPVMTMAPVPPAAPKVWLRGVTV